MELGLSNENAETGARVLFVCGNGTGNAPCVATYE